MIHFIQSKFRTTEENFNKKNIELDELLKMDVDRITEGIDENERGIKYNSKIKKLLSKIQEIDNLSRWKYNIIILANVKGNITKAKMKRIVGDFPYEIFDHTKCYSDLVFPIISGTYYNVSDLYIEINLTKDTQSSQIEYYVETEATACIITVIFIPTSEIGRIMSRYKNSILTYNPRSYLSLSSNPVNFQIGESIKNKPKNEFSLYNNGITMLSDETRLNTRVAKPFKGQLHVKNPQIINGGQTAYTLSQIYEEALSNEEDIEHIFGEKEVMLKVITFLDGDQENPDVNLRINLIDSISKATNNQTPVVQADRKSNDPIQLGLEQNIFDEFGYFYERKKGQFFDGRNKKYLDSDLIIDRIIFLRICFAISGRPAIARRTSANILFEDKSFFDIFETLNNEGVSYKELFFGYTVYQELDRIEKSYRSDPNNKFGVLNFGNALRYGRYSVVWVVYSRLNIEITSGNVFETAQNITQEVLAEWLEFEDYARGKKSNNDYFRKVFDSSTGKEGVEANFAGYYKVQNVTQDIREYFAIKENDKAA